MNSPTNVIDLIQINPAARLYATHYAEHEFGALDGLWEVGGRVPGNEPALWRERRGDSVAGRVSEVDGLVIGDAAAAWQYLNDTDEEILWASMCEDRARIVVDPIAAVVATPNPISVTIARKHLVDDLGMTDDEACRHLIAGAVERTAGLPEIQRETIVGRIQWAVDAIEADDGGLRLRRDEARVRLDV